MRGRKRAADHQDHDENRGKKKSLKTKAMQTTNGALRTLATSYAFWKGKTKMTTVSDSALPALETLNGL
jgi:hypothetical protein